tara:strand:- start:630 stop:803 length:174 start_codon:yes stop_codon:yes gene_type:complete
MIQIEAINEEVKGTYADKASNENFESITWNHPISEVLNELINRGINIELLDEFNYSP